MAFTLNRDVFSLYVVILLFVTTRAAGVVSLSSEVHNPAAHRIFGQWMAEHGISYKDATEKEKCLEIFQRNCVTLNISTVQETEPI